MTTGTSMNTMPVAMICKVSSPAEPRKTPGSATRSAATTTVTASMSMPNARSRRVNDVRRSPFSSARSFMRSMLGRKRESGIDAQKPSMAPDVLTMMSSTSNRRYGCR